MAPCYRYLAGSGVTPLTRTSKCRCGPVDIRRGRSPPRYRSALRSSRVSSIRCSCARAARLAPTSRLPATRAATSSRCSAGLGVADAAAHGGAACALPNRSCRRASSWPVAAFTARGRSRPARVAALSRPRRHGPRRCSAGPRAPRALWPTVSARRRAGAASPACAAARRGCQRGGCVSCAAAARSVLPGVPPASCGAGGPDQAMRPPVPAPAGTRRPTLRAREEGSCARPGTYARHGRRPSTVDGRPAVGRVRRPGSAAVRGTPRRQRSHRR
jgi:hypothetical protein